MTFSVPRRILSMVFLGCTMLAMLLLVRFFRKSLDDRLEGGGLTRGRDLVALPMMRDFTGQTLVLPVDPFRQRGYAYATLFADEADWLKLEALVEVIPIAWRDIALIISIIPTSP